MQGLSRPSFTYKVFVMAMEPILNVAKIAAEEAGKIIERCFYELDKLEIQTKETNDFVTQIDKLAEAEIIDKINYYYKGKHKILGEEGGAQGPEDAFFEWIIDPLDGTTNFIHGFPQFCVSIAVLYKGKLDHAVIYDPIKREMFSASKGRGAWLNNKRIRVTGQKGFAGSLIGTGFPFRESQFSYMDDYLKMFKAVAQQAAGIRRAGSAALDLAYVASGRLDAFWELGLRSWDIAAGALIIREAGGLVSDIDGGEKFLETGDIVAANPKMFSLLLKTIGSFRPEK